jgi:hypothetical protein
VVLTVLLVRARAPVAQTAPGVRMEPAS